MAASTPEPEGSVDTDVSVACLSLTQPWASLVASGAKRIETRTWPTRYRGPLAIHAAQRFPREERELCMREPFRSALASTGARLITEGVVTPTFDVPRGAVIAVVDMVDCVRITRATRPARPERDFGDYREGRWAWMFGVARLAGFQEPASGRMQLWRWTPADPLRRLQLMTWLSEGPPAVEIAAPE